MDGMYSDSESRDHATRLLSDWSSSGLSERAFFGLDSTGSEGIDASELSVMMYDEMRQLARSMMNNERQNHTLQPTALVHEAFLRLINTDGLDVRSQDHFFLLASRVMRRILIDHARTKNRLKRGGEWCMITMSIAEAEAQSPFDPSELLAIDEALEKLRKLDERKAKVVELRFFGGLDEETAARILGIARSTASSDWRFARAWLMDQLKSTREPSSDG